MVPKWMSNGTFRKAGVEIIDIGIGAAQINAMVERKHLKIGAP